MLAVTEERFRKRLPNEQQQPALAATFTFHFNYISASYPRPTLAILVRYRKHLYQGWSQRTYVERIPVLCARGRGGRPAASMITAAWLGEQYATVHQRKSPYHEEGDEVLTGPRSGTVGAPDGVGKRLGDGCGRRSTRGGSRMARMGGRCVQGTQDCRHRQIDFFRTLGGSELHRGYGRDCRYKMGAYVVIVSKKTKQPYSSHRGPLLMAMSSLVAYDLLRMAILQTF